MTKNDEEKTFQQAGKRRKDLTDMEKWIQDREENKWTSFPDYEKRAKEINRSLLMEERDRNSRIERARKEEKSWELIRLCTKFFDEYCDTWKENGVERRKLEEKERQREERK